MISNVQEYWADNKMSVVLRSNQDFHEHPDICFPTRARIIGSLEHLWNNLVLTAMLGVQTIGSGLCPWYRKRANRKSDYLCGTAIMGHRQVWDNERTPDFIIDNEDIKADDVICFPLVSLDKEHVEETKKYSCTMFYPPKRGRLFSHFSKWKTLFLFALQNGLLRNNDEIKAACIIFWSYFRWLRILQSISLRHFISHCDLGIDHIGRNLALNQAGVQTWYFTDSMNFLINFRGEDGTCRMRSPQCCYIYYDHFVTWNGVLEKFFKDHPGAFKRVHVVGCLWSSHIREKVRARRRMQNLASVNIGEQFVVAAFDSTYTRNGITSYVEGLAFAEHLFQLARDFSGILILFKEKKDRSVHGILDPVLGPKLLDIYNNMKAHPRIVMCSARIGTSSPMSVSDIVVSFPFTSTTYEALSSNRPAVWHDPLGYYQTTPYARIGGLTTHSYDELRTKIQEIRATGSDNYQNPIPMDSPLADPYCDGKAVDRFRDLLSSPL